VRGCARGGVSTIDQAVCGRVELHRPGRGAAAPPGKPRHGAAGRPTRARPIERTANAAATGESSFLPREFRLLEYMMRRKEQMTHALQFLLEEVWNYKFVPQTNLVDVNGAACGARCTTDEPAMIHNSLVVVFILLCAFLISPPPPPLSAVRLAVAGAFVLAPGNWFGVVIGPTARLHDSSYGPLLLSEVSSNRARRSTAGGTRSHRARRAPPHPDLPLVRGRVSSQSSASRCLPAAQRGTSRAMFQ